MNSKSQLQYDRCSKADPLQHTFHNCKLVWTSMPSFTWILIAMSMMAGSSVIFLAAALAALHNLAILVLDSLSTMAKLMKELLQEMDRS